MTGNLLTWLVIVVVTVVFGWLTWRAWRAKRWFVKWPGVVLSGLLTLTLAAVSVTAAIGLYTLYVPRGSPVEALQVAGTSEQIARGEHLALIECVDCHTTNKQLPLSGGRNLAEDIPIPIGDFYSINLTPGGPLKDWSDGEIMRVLNEGVDRDGRPLVIMSANTVRYFNADDKQAIIAYLRSQPAVDNPTPLPADQPNLLGAVMVGAGLLPFQPPVTVALVPKAATAAYGEYIVSWRGCRICHGPDLGGGTGKFGGFEVPVGPNLRVVQGWTVEQFVTTLRTGVDPSGHAMDNTQMPWETIGLLDDEEMGALYAYLKALPPAQ
ncbi:MAG TPA: c-type cytochrome [Anaerolineales bacterium]|nr:c-type cytochrome [Anaerolineales bacterium]